MTALEWGAALAAGGYFTFLLMEAWSLKLARRALRIVVHVNGTRGKTETTRLIAAGLRAGGIRTLAKTTGTLPCMILEDGTEKPWRRLGTANVREQRDFLRLAVRRKAEAIVVECMAVYPDTQRASTAFLEPSVLVVTNARPDHGLELGTPDEALAVFAEGIPAGGVVITADASIHAELSAEAARRNTTMILAEPFEASWASHSANAGAALAVLERLAVPRAIALQGMARHLPDPGAFAIRELTLATGGSLTIVDALAANDPVSTELLFQRAGPPEGPRILLLADPADRQDRAQAFARWAVEARHHWDSILLAGDHVPGVHRILSAHPRVRRLSRMEDLIHEAEGTVIFAAGNWRVIGPALAALAPAISSMESLP